MVTTRFKSSQAGVNDDDIKNSRTLNAFKINLKVYLYPKNIFWYLKELHSTDLLHKESEKKGSMVAKKKVFKAIKILLKPMGLREEYSFPIVL